MRRLGTLIRILTVLLCGSVLGGCPSPGKTSPSSEASVVGPTTDATASVPAPSVPDATTGEDTGAQAVMTFSHCSVTSETKALDPDETAITGELKSLPWDTEFFLPLSSERLRGWPVGPQHGAARLQPLGPGELDDLWKLYRRVRSSPPTPKPSCVVDPRSIVTFSTNKGVSRWASISCACPLIHTEDSVCHEDLEFFRKVVNILGNRSTLRGCNPDLLKKM